MSEEGKYCLLFNIKKQNMKNKMLVIKGLLCAMAISMTVAQAQNNPPARISTTRTHTSDYNWLNVQSDSTGDPTKLITLHKSNEVYKIKVTNEKIVEMYIDDKKVPESDFAKHASMVKEILEQVKRDEEQAARDREQAERDRRQADKDRQQAEKDRQQADRDRERADQDRVQANQHREQAERDRAQSQRDREQADKDRAQAERDRQRADQDRVQAGRDREQAERDRRQADKDRAQAEIDRKQAEEDRKKMAAFFEDLVKENIVGSKEEVRVAELTDESFIVNDKKQPDAIHRKFKSKYLSGSGSRLRYTSQNGNRHFGIYNNE